VVLFNPSSTGLETMSKRENKLPNFRFHPVGLAGRTGTVEFAAPLNYSEGSWFSRQPGQGTSRSRASLYQNLLRENKHDQIDLPKIMSKGRSTTCSTICYAVIFRSGRLRLSLFIAMRGIRRGQSIKAILKLVAAGYELL
jgi:hypothetical protein